MIHALATSCLFVEAKLIDVFVAHVYVYVLPVRFSYFSSCSYIMLSYAIPSDQFDPMVYLYLLLVVGNIYLPRIHQSWLCASVPTQIIHLLTLDPRKIQQQKFDVCPTNQQSAIVQNHGCGWLPFFKTWELREHFGLSY